ncbi:MAG TPA: phage holin family protein [Usitatibacter sp.]|nr:phage holin family protein [Usitatibacter sp.]
MREVPGLVGNVRGLASVGLRMVRTRLELIAIEFQEEKAHAVRQVVIASAVLYLVTFGTLLAILAVGLAMPAGARETFFACLAFVFLALGALGVAWLGALARRRSFLGETLAVLGRDEQALGSGGE